MSPCDSDVDGSWRRYGRVVDRRLTVADLPSDRGRLPGRCRAGGGTRPSTPSRLVDRLLDAGAIHPHVDAPISDAVSASTFTMADVTLVTPQLGGAVAADGRVVVDDGSQPATRRGRAPAPGEPWTRCSSQRRTRARGRRRSSRSSTPTSRFDAGWLDALLPHFDDDRVGLVAPRVTGERGSPLDLGAGTRPHPCRDEGELRPRSAALVIRVTAFDSIGGFDEQMRFGEDVDLVWRLDEVGWRCRYEPASIVAHQPRPTVRRPNAPARRVRHVRRTVGAAPSEGSRAGRLEWLDGVGLGARSPRSSRGRLRRSRSDRPPRSSRKLPDLPPSESFKLAMRGHAGAAEQIGHALRREWWPLLAVGALVSRRARWIGAGRRRSVGARSLPTDIAYGWGVWRGVPTSSDDCCRSSRRLLAWPPRPTRRNYGRAA